MYENTIKEVSMVTGKRGGREVWGVGERKEMDVYSRAIF